MQRRLFSCKASIIGIFSGQHPAKYKSLIDTMGITGKLGETRLVLHENNSVSVFVGLGSRSAPEDENESIRKAVPIKNLSLLLK